MKYFVEGPSYVSIEFNFDVFSKEKNLIFCPLSSIKDLLFVLWSKSIDCTFLFFREISKAKTNFK